MEYKELRKSLLFGMIVVAFLGTLFHFVYDWSGQNTIVGFLFPTNESTWEHMNLVYLPMLILTILFYCMYDIKNKVYETVFWTATIIGPWILPVIVYTYRGILGFGVMWMDTATYYICLVVITIVMLFAMKYIGEMEVPIINFCLRIVTVLMGIIFIWFSYNPLNLGIFQAVAQ